MSTDELGARGTDPAPAPRARKVIRSAGFVLAVQVFGAGGAFIVQVLLARFLGTNSYGQYASFLAAATFASLFVGLGLSGAGVRFIPVYRAARDWPRLAGFLSTAHRVTMLGGIAVAVCGLVGAVAVELLGQAPVVAPLAAASILVPVLGLSALYTETGRACHRAVAAMFPPFVLRPIFIAAIIVAIHLMAGSVDAAAALAAMTAAMAIVSLIQYATVWRPAQPPGRPHRVFDFRQWLGVGLPLVASSTFGTTLLQVDLIVVGLICGSTDAALYAAASKSAVLVSYVILAINATATPHFPTLWSSGRLNDLQRFLDRMAVAIFLPSLALATVMAIAAVPIMELFGSDFIGGATVLRILLLGQVVNSAAGSVAYLLNLTGHQRKAATALAISAAAAVALTAIGAWALGIVGAAIGSVLGFLIWNTWLYVLVVRHVGVHASVITRPRLVIQALRSQVSRGP